MNYDHTPGLIRITLWRAGPLKNEKNGQIEGEWGSGGEKWKKCLKYENEGPFFGDFLSKLMDWGAGLGILLSQILEAQKYPKIGLE